MHYEVRVSSPDHDTKTFYVEAVTPSLAIDHVSKILHYSARGFFWS